MIGENYSPDPSNTNIESPGPVSYKTEERKRPMERSKKGKGKLKTPDARREYQREYYQRNKEKAKEYQRKYNLTHKKKNRGNRRGKNPDYHREVIQMTFTPYDIIHSPVEKSVRMLEQICKGERFFTM